jgi:hypothetical protein
LTHREEDKRVRRGKAAAKGATVIFWRLAGGEEEELLAVRVLLFDLEAITLPRYNAAIFRREVEDFELLSLAP